MFYRIVLSFNNVTLSVLHYTTLLRIQKKKKKQKQNIGTEKT